MILKFLVSYDRVCYHKIHLTENLSVKQTQAVSITVKEGIPQITNRIKVNMDLHD